jgi:hypothetical protein
MYIICVGRVGYSYYGELILCDGLLNADVQCALALL